MCSFCNTEEEDLDHLLHRCREVTNLWENNGQQWMQRKLGIDIRLTPTMKMLGYIVKDENFWPLNLVLMTTRKYIFLCSRKGFKLNVFFLQQEVHRIFLEQETLSYLNSREAQFNKRWEFWRNLFVNI